MKIFVLCRHNQDRSIVIAAFLRKHFPFLTVYSAGIEAAENSQIPDPTRTLCQSWDLEIKESISLLWDGLKESIEPDDIVICADEKVYQTARLTIHAGQLINLVDSGSLEFLIPQAPADTSQTGLEHELAKCLVQTVRLLAPYISGMSQEITHAYIPHSEEQLEETLGLMHKQLTPSKLKNQLF